MGVLVFHILPKKESERGKEEVNKKELTLNESRPTARQQEKQSLEAASDTPSENDSPQVSDVEGEEGSDPTSQVYHILTHHRAFFDGDLLCIINCLNQANRDATTPILISMALDKCHDQLEELKTEFSKLSPDETGKLANLQKLRLTQVGQQIKRFHEDIDASMSRLTLLNDLATEVGEVSEEGYLPSSLFKMLQHEYLGIGNISKSLRCE